MRPFQVMRYGRRITPTANELTQSITQSRNLTTIPRRQSSMSVFGSEHRQDSHQCVENDNSIVERKYITYKTSIENRLVNIAITKSMDSSSTTPTTTLNKRNTLNIQKPLVTLDGIDLSRRGSFNNGRRLSFQQQDVTESSKSKTNLKNFYVFFVLLFLFIFIAVVYSFIRMIKNQVA